VHPCRESLHAGKKTLPPVPPHLDGHPARAERGEADETLNGDAVLPSEGPAEIRGDDTHPVHLESQGGGNLLPVPVGGLRRCNDDEHPGFIDPGPAGLRFQVGVLLARRLEDALDHDVAAAKGPVGVSPSYADGPHEVAFLVVPVDPGHTLHQGLFGIEDTRQRLVVEGDEFERLTQGLAALGHHQGDGVSRVPDGLINKHRLMVPDDPQPVRPGDIEGSQDANDTGMRRGTIGVNG
jgi:hypothetical protein